MPAANREGLADAMIWMKENPVEAQALGLKAFQFVKENHSSSVHYRLIMRCYRSVQSRTH